MPCSSDGYPSATEMRHMDQIKSLKITLGGLLAVLVKNGGLDAVKERAPLWLNARIDKRLVSARTAYAQEVKERKRRRIEAAPYREVAAKVVNQGVEALDAKELKLLSDSRAQKELMRLLLKAKSLKKAKHAKSKATK